ncbi:unnamed protein product [Moneuplotes crassus]|uniref:Histidine kinase domain-containing protein n=1 Tax=Euplotes crassus TaxID=5936 RepID=A0AAD2D9W7_EUPCR|nr:unnamed protein product [Moneuplotes crassus]
MGIQFCYILMNFCRKRISLLKEFFISKKKLICNFFKNTMDLYNYFSGYDEEVDRYINEVIEESIEKKYTKYIKIVCWATIILCLITVVMGYSDISDVNKETNWQTCVNCIIFSILLLAALVALKIKPIYITYFIPIIIGVGIYMVILLTIQKRYYRLSEFHITMSTLSHTLLILVPTQWKSSALAHNLCLIYLVYAIWKTYGIVNTDMISSAVFSCFYFILSSYMLIIKTRNMYSEILKNKRLIKEMKKVMQILPFGVVIWPAKANEKWFINQEFTNKFTKIRKDLSDLKDIDISFIDNSDEANAHQTIPHDLEGLLKSQQQMLDDQDSMVDQDIKIHCNPQGNLLIHKDSYDEAQRTCNVKTLMVEWEGTNAFMHVFVDNTNVIKLEEAKNNIKCQKIMFTSASHEFRTPLNSITNSFDIVLNSFQELHNISKPYLRQLRGAKKEAAELNTDMITKFIKIGKSSSLLLLTLIEDVLNLSKMEAGTFKLTKSVFSVKALLDEIFDIFEMQCLRKNLDFRLEMTEEVSRLELNSDEGRIKQVILNLMSNSMKFTFRGYIKIECKIARDWQNTFVEFAVEDSGIGITEEQQQQLFKLFSMVSDPNSINPNGTGIGLTISKKYVEAIGGNIHLESEAKKGTLVVFTIPIEEEPEHMLKQPNDDIIPRYTSLSTTLLIPLDPSPPPLISLQKVQSPQTSCTD